VLGSLEVDNLVVFNNLTVSEIWPDRRGVLWRNGLYKRGITVVRKKVRFSVFI
jgi:hypothetical protein